MKHLLLTVGLCFLATTGFAQKKAVSDAERIAKDSKPDFTEARALIQSALENPETSGQAKTWYIAGQVEDAQFNAENTKQMLGQQPNEAVMYEALNKELPFYVKAYELDQQPNEKGKIKPRYSKNIKSTLAVNHIYYLNGGAYYFDQKDYKKACELFDQYIEVANLPFFEGEKPAERDSNFMIVQFYSAVASTQVGDKELSIKNLRRAKDFPYRQNDVYQYLCYEYEQAKDSVNLEKTLEEGVKVFPDSSYYLLSLINLYIYSNRNEKAIDLLTTAISLDGENAQLYNAMGSVYETGIKDYDKAESYFIKAIEFDPNSAINQSNLGRVYYNQAVSKLSDANAITDTKQYNQEKAVAKELFKKAMPYFEKAHELKPDDTEYMIALRGIYYNLDMGTEFDAIETKMNQ